MNISGQLEQLTQKLTNKFEDVEKINKEIEETKQSILDLLVKNDAQSYENDIALYSVKTSKNNSFNEEKLKVENKELYEQYLKTTISFDITRFKKEQGENNIYIIKGTPTKSLMIKNKKKEK